MAAERRADTAQPEPPNMNATATNRIWDGIMKIPTKDKDVPRPENLSNARENCSPVLASGRTSSTPGQTNGYNDSLAVCQNERHTFPHATNRSHDCLQLFLHC